MQSLRLSSMPYVDLCIILNSAFLTWAAQLQGPLAQKRCFNKLRGSRDPGTHQWRRNCTGRSTKNLRKSSHHGKPTKNIRKTYGKHTKNYEKPGWNLCGICRPLMENPVSVVFLYVFCMFFVGFYVRQPHAGGTHRQSTWDITLNGMCSKARR